MKNKLQIGIILEFFWLIIFILTLIKGIMETIQKGISVSYMFFIMSFLAVILYLARRSLRLKGREKNLKDT